jgi:hypothetical protein
LNYELWDICVLLQKMLIFFQVLHGLRTCGNRWAVISPWTIHFKFIGCMSYLLVHSQMKWQVSFHMSVLPHTHSCRLQNSYDRLLGPQDSLSVVMMEEQQRPSSGDSLIAVSALQEKYNTPMP